MSTPDFPQPSDLEPQVPISEPPPPPPLHERSEVLRLLRYLYNHNPFYPISAVLILMGLHQVFYDAESARNITAINFHSGILMAVIAGYAVVLAIIVCLIVRLGQVWDDARTILLTLVLLLVTLSINGDKPILMHAGAASWFLVGGLLFSILLCETVLRLTGIALPWLLRGPFYLFLALFFLYPAGLDYCLNIIGDTNQALGKRLTLLGVLLFPTAAGMIGLLLLPAAMRGPKLAAQNSSPWTWPLYPWSLFVILGVAVVLRAFYLTVSFHPRQGTDSAFHIYFLTPFLLVVAAIVFELAKSVGRIAWQQAALGSSLLLLPLSLPGFPCAGPAADFMNLHREFFGAPIQVACVGVALLLAYATLRGGPAWAAELVPYPIALLAFTRNDTLHINSFQAPVWEPLAAAAALLAIRAVRSPRSSFRWTTTAAMGIAALTTGLWNTPFTAYRGAPAWHLLLVALTLICLVCADSFAQFLRRIVALAFIGLATGGVTYASQSMYAPSPWVTLSYVATLAVVTWLMWGVLRGPDQLTAAALVTAAAATQVGLMLSAAVRQSSSPQGLALVLSGIASLIIAAAISATKVRVAQRLTPDNASS